MTQCYMLKTLSWSKEQFEDICEKTFSLHIIPTNFFIKYIIFFLEQMLN